MSEFLIRPMAEADVSRIAELETICFSDPWSENSIRSELENELSFWLVAEREGCVYAYAGSQTVPPEADVMNVAVAPEYRNQGLGEELLRALARELRSRGAVSLTLEVRVSNLSARRLYEKVGFREIGRRRNYYELPREDALILRRSLEEGDDL